MFHLFPSLTSHPNTFIKYIVYLQINNFSTGSQSTLHLKRLLKYTPETFHSFYESPPGGTGTASLADFRRVGDLGGLGDNGGDRCIGTPDLAFLVSEKYQNYII